ncbi:L,D-transpeptidase [Solemya pervernicosa gill symbiont]|uniref:L,D-transpeptidase n=2 Tax=Gammaproteobacteria incertae sedis TaxID=118884 RepID=A0A1T2L079_9GAMM|nr:L,D-transpeptidase family protein [Candidatus Reidiella endopervernicosa]OOZ38356.1 L,D-transpeptidase [Solemya pervernicosa gill symbiont]QKQ27871.1 L,D-transpeptidase family protein [Candidatus Reidiella endopervernicosa]
MNECRLLSLLLTALLLTLRPAVAATMILPPAEIGLVGAISHVEANEEDTLLDIARRYDFGQEEIVLANPDVDRWLPHQGAWVRLPGRHILPQVARRGVVLNVSEMRLYYFPDEQSMMTGHVITHPVSIGRMDWLTPLGPTSIIAKKLDPTWTPPASIKKEAMESGEPLPDVVPAGPDNPLGRYAIRLGRPGYLIHSTNKPFGVGMRVTHGCVRMYPEDIERLFPEVPVGTPVQIIDQPVKAGWFADTLYIEVHPPLEEAPQDEQTRVIQAMEAIHQAVGREHVLIRGATILKAVREQSGVPVPISIGFR